MTHYDNIVEKLRNFDMAQQAPIRDDGEIARMIRAVVPENEEWLPLAWAELAAFSLLEDSKYGRDNWNTYYGPEVRNLRNGEKFEVTPLEKITADVVSYWERRIGECTNPVLKSRYAGLVWEFSRKIRDIKPDYSKVGIAYLSSLLQAGENKRYQFSRTVFTKLGRALSLAIGFKNENLKKQAIQAIRNYVHESEMQGFPQTWHQNYDLIVKDNYKEIESAIILEIIAELENKLTQCTTPNDENIIALNSVHVALDRLLDYYVRIKSKTDVQRVLSRLAAAYETQFPNLKVTQTIHHLERLHEYYKANNLTSEAVEVYKRIQLLSPAIIDEMARIGSEVTISKDLIDEQVGKLLSGSLTEIFMRMAFGFIPDGNIQQPGLGRQSISGLFTRSIHDGTGRRVAKIGPSQDDASGNRLSNMATNMTFDAVFLFFGVKAGKEQGIFTVSNIMEVLKSSCLISPDRYKLVEMGITAYLEEDYITALHILIPQIEAACLKLLELNGGSIWREGKNGGDNIRIFDDVLRDPIFVSSLGEQEATYFRALFTDQRGWNLRNKICHGMMKSDSFDVQKADRVFVALLLLGHIRFTMYEPQEKTS